MLGRYLGHYETIILIDFSCLSVPIPSDPLTGDDIKLVFRIQK